MHVIQDSYDVHVDCVYKTEYAWLCEATATWAMLWIYPNTAVAGAYSKWFFQPNSDPPPLELKNGTHEYGAFLFFYFLTHHFSNDSLIRTIWENTQTKTGLEAVDSAIPGGFGAVWDKFALYNWDEAPYDHYKTWTGLTVNPETYQGRKPSITEPYVDRIFVASLSHLSMAYHHFTFSGEQPRLVTFFNGFLYRLSHEPLQLPTLPGLRTADDGSLQLRFDRAPDTEIKGAKVQILYKVEGDIEWTLQDVTDRPYLTWCRDATSERLQELVIIYSNSEYTPATYRAGATGGRSAELQVNNLGCYQYAGEATAYYGAAGPPWMTIDDLQEVEDVVWERTAAFPDITYPYIAFSTTSGDWNRTCTATGICSGQATDSTSFAQSDANFLYVLYGLEGGANRSYTGEGNLARILTFTVDCGEYGTEVLDPPSFWWFAVDILTLVSGQPFEADGSAVLHGSGNMDPTSGRFTWHFAPKRED